MILFARTAGLNLDHGTRANPISVIVCPSVGTLGSSMISVVIPVYNEEVLVDELHRRVAAAMNSMDENWQVVYVNDGSRDRTLEMLLDYQKTDPHVVVVNLTRNGGHQSAVTAGLSVATGDAIVLMDGDL